MEALIDCTLPVGDPIQCSQVPKLTPAHRKRLRELFSRGRPSATRDLGGIELDLLVHGFIQTMPERSSATPVLAVTRQGLTYLNEARQTLVKSQSAHHELGSRLCMHLQKNGFLTWENVEFLNPDWSPSRSWGVVRTDVFACIPALKARSAAPAIYEVKVNRADFLADVAKLEKRTAYAAIAEAVYYCCPAGLIAKGEVPEGFGLVWEVAPGEFKIERKARRAKDFSLHADIAMTLMVKRQVFAGAEAA